MVLRSGLGFDLDFTWHVHSLGHMFTELNTLAIEVAQSVVPPYLWQWVRLRSERRLPEKRTGLRLPTPPCSVWASVSSHACWCGTWAWTWAASHLWSRRPRRRPGWGSPQRSSSHTQTPPHPPILSPPADGSLAHKHTHGIIDSKAHSHRMNNTEMYNFVWEGNLLAAATIPPGLLSPMPPLLSVWLGNLVFYHRYPRRATTIIWLKKIYIYRYIMVWFRR